MSDTIPGISGFVNFLGDWNLKSFGGRETTQKWPGKKRYHGVLGLLESDELRELATLDDETTHKQGTSYSTGTSIHWDLSSAALTKNQTKAAKGDRLYSSMPNSWNNFSVRFSDVGRG